MAFKQLWAKSERKDETGARIPPPTIREHTSLVMRTGEALVDATGEAQLRALGLDPGEWLDRFRRAVLVAALFHDVGKANIQFQKMVHGRRSDRTPQGIRHEAVSFLIASLPEIQEWIAPALEGSCRPELVLYAVAGHHRKFPAPTPEHAGAVMNVYLDHEDFRRTLELGCEEYGLELRHPPRFGAKHALTTLKLPTAGSMFNPLRDAEVTAEELMEQASVEERRFLAGVKACLICADVAGSIGCRGDETMADWIPQAFNRAPTSGQLNKIVSDRLKGKELRSFQAEVADAVGDLVLTLAGCGTGKTVAAYARGAARYPGRRVFFCYPTTGTATEGYRDYLSDPSLGAELIHGRSDVDKTLLLGDAPRDADPPDLDEDEAPEPGEAGKQVVESMSQKEQAAADSAGALEQWSTPLVGCTVDTVLGLVQNNRRGIYAWPSIAGSFCIFDEVHSYDARLFGALIRFLRDVPGVPCLLMTASLPTERLERLRQVMKERGASGEPIQGPEDLEVVKRYVRSPAESVADAWRFVEEARARGEKVLWVVNTVDAAMCLAEEADRLGLKPLVYHSRFRYIDRIERHRAVVDSFDREKSPGFSLAITTQVAEMSLDLSADLLVTQLAPIPSLIQRLGRLLRFANPDGSSGLRPFVILEPGRVLPYDEADLHAARAWLASLGSGAVSQRDLFNTWAEKPSPAPRKTPDVQACWIDGGFTTQPGVLREGGPGIDVIRKYDADAVKVGRTRVEEVRLPMPSPKGKGKRWRDWPVVGFCPVAPDEAIYYEPERGARWND